VLYVHINVCLPSFIIIRATLLSAVFAVERWPAVCPSVCHTAVLCING